MRSPRHYSSISRWLFLCLVACSVAETAAGAGGRLTIRACQQGLEEMGYLPEEVEAGVMRALARTGIAPKALHEHVERVFRSMTGRGGAERLDIRRLARSGMNDGEETLLEGLAYRILDRLVRETPVRGRRYSAIEDELGEAPELAIVTHLTGALQRAMDHYLDATDESLGLRRKPWLFLVDPATIDHLTASSAALATVVRPSRGGEFDIALGARKIHVMGGFVDDCLPKTIHSASTSALQGRVRAVEIAVHVAMTYHGDGESLAVLRQRDRAAYRRLLEGLGETIAEEYAADRQSIASIAGRRGDVAADDYVYELRRSDGKTITIRFLAPPP